jgi:hypothetical protein
VQRDAGGGMISETQFQAAYEEVLNENTKHVLASQKAGDLYHDERGVAIGSGEIWFKYLSGIEGFRVTMFHVNKYAAVGVGSMEETKQLDELFGRFQRAMENGDRDGALATLAFPIRVNYGRRSRIFRNRAELSESFDQVFTAKVKKALQMQRVSRLFVNSDGIMVGTGQLWFSPEGVGRNLRLHVTTINN